MNVCYNLTMFNQEFLTFQQDFILVYSFQVFKEKLRNKKKSLQISTQYQELESHTQDKRPTAKFLKCTHSKIPSEFPLLQDEQVQLSQFQPLQHLDSPPLNSFQYAQVSLVLGGAELDTVLHVLSDVEQRGRISFLDLLVIPCLSQL